MKTTYLPTRLDLMKLMPPKSVGVEIGVLRGDFTTEILACDVAKVFLVDPWSEQRPEVYTDTWNGCNHRDNLCYVQSRFAPEIASGRVTVIQGLSEIVATTHPEIPPLDWVFVDGNHSYAFVLLDLILWSKRLKPDGVILGHDYVKFADFGVIEAVTEFCTIYGWELEYLTQEADWPSFALRRKATSS